MNNQLDELTKSMTQSVTRCAPVKKFCLWVAGTLLAGLLALSSSAANTKTQSSTVFDPAGDALFPFDLYNGLVPPYLDILKASVSSSRGVFHFEVQVNSDIPADASPALTPSVNHLGVTVGILTDTKATGSPFKFFGQPDTYHFNFLVGGVYSVADSGIGLPLGWSGFLIDVSTFTAVEIPLQIYGDTLVFETSAASLGNPSSFDWLVAAECDPVPVVEETKKSTLLVDFAPDHGFATWPAQ